MPRPPRRDREHCVVRLRAAIKHQPVNSLTLLLRNRDSARKRATEEQRQAGKYSKFVPVDQQLIFVNQNAQLGFLPLSLNKHGKYAKRRIFWNVVAI